MNSTNNIRSYTELSRLQTFEDRFNYLRLHGKVGSETFGFERYFNQMFYNSKEWKTARNAIIVRDHGCDLGVSGYDISDGVPIYIHHINPITVDDIENGSTFLFDPEYLITTTIATHNAIHYGIDHIPSTAIIERRVNDTCPWKVGGKR